MTLYENPLILEELRQGFKYFNRFMLLMWRLGLGNWLNAWPKVIGRIMVITHTGRKSGARRQTPLNYTILDGDVYCTAGFGSGSDWYRNILSNSKVEVWLPEGWWSGIAEDVTNEKDRLTLLRQVLIASGFAARAAGINPHAITDAELDAVTADYRLIRIRRAAPRTGRDGPGDLAWVWPLATFILLPIAFLRSGRRRSK